VLGRLKSGSYAGGLIQLDEGRAVAAVESRVAKPLGIDRTAAAAGIIRLMEQKVQHAVEQVSLERGYDPARFTLVAGGGAGAMHAAAVARSLGCRGAYVPRLAGVFCAFGMCNSDVRHDYVQTWLGELDAVVHSDVERDFATLEAKGRATLTDDGFAAEAIDLKRLLDLRYRGQQWSIQVPIETPFAPSAIRQEFEERYRRLYGHDQPDGISEILALRLVAKGVLARIDFAPEPNGTGKPKPVETRDVYVDAQKGRQRVPVYRGGDLKPSQTITGPAVIEETTTTVVIGVGDVLRVDPYRNYAISFDEKEPA
jgi:N-methylhydantoinase A